MVDLIKFYLENVWLSDYILATKFIRIKKEGGFEYFRADPDKISFLSKDNNTRKNGHLLKNEIVINKKILLRIFRTRTSLSVSKEGRTKMKEGFQFVKI